MTVVCDNKSVGVIIINQYDEVLLLERARFPLGLAPPAGHIDEHGSDIAAAIAEVQEEAGIVLRPTNLTKKIAHRRVENKCRRVGGDYHVWDIYTATVDDTFLSPDPHETNGAAWYTKGEIQELITKTLSLNHEATQDDMPVLELFWVGVLIELGYAHD